MASEFDELVEHLLYVIAVNDGLSHGDLTGSIRNFYASRYDLDTQPIQPQAKDLLFSDEPPPIKPNVDAAFIQNIWEWLCKHKDVVVCAGERDELSSGSPTDTTTTPANGLRLTTTNERIWQAIAGHGVDTTRIKNAELLLLRIIAKHGSTGIIQPDLVKESGQDKRSVPKRTDALAANGYIDKQAIIASGTRTSILKLTRFAELTDHFPESAAQPGRGVIYYDQWFDMIIDILNKNNKIIVLDDLRVGLNINQNSHETRALNRCLRRVVRTGCMRRIQATVAGKRRGEAGSKLNCLQLLRDPTDADRRTFSQHALKKSSAPNRKTGIHLALTSPQKDNDDDDGDEGDDDDAEGGDEIEVSIGEGGALQTIDSNTSTRIPPQWIPEIPITNFVFELIDNAGPAGLGTMDVHHRGFGPAWRRPVDELLIRMCHQWETSQPSHLKHLSILKDTAMRQRTHFFLYRTRAMFEKAVEQGHTYWEAVQVETNAKGKKRTDTNYEGAKPVLDSWGFPVLPSKLFAGNKDGTATLDECEAFARPRARKWRGGRPRNTVYAHTATNEEGHDPDTNSRDPTASLQQTAHMPEIVSNKRSADTLLVNEMLRAQKRARTASEPFSQATTMIRAAPNTNAETLSVPSAAPLDALTSTHGGEPHESIPQSPNVDADQTVRHADKFEENNLDQSKAMVSSSRVLLNPPGALRMKLDHQPVHKGRPKKHMIVVFKLTSLTGKPWFVSDIDPRTPPRPRRKRVIEDTVARPKRYVRHRIDDDDHEEDYTLPSVQPQMTSVRRQNSSTASSVTGVHSKTPVRRSTHRHEPEEATIHKDSQCHQINLDSPNINRGIEIPNRAARDASQAPGPLSQPPNTKSATSILLHPGQDIDASGTIIECVESASSGANKKHGVSKASGAIAIKRTKIVMDIISKCGGVFPGNREIYNPMSAAWRQLSGTTVDFLTVDNTIKDLLSRGKLRKLVFQFYDSQSLLVRRAILTEPHISPNAPAVQELKSKIEKAHPAKYIPPIVHEDEAKNKASSQGQASDQQAVRSSDHKQQYMGTNGHSTAGSVQNKENQRNGQQTTKQSTEIQRSTTLVQRTEAGLEMAAKRRQELIAKLRSARQPSTPSRRSRVGQSSLDLASDEDTDEGDVDPEQAKLMSKFQLDTYKPVFAHARDPEPAFRTLHPRAAFVSSIHRQSTVRSAASVSIRPERSVHKEPSLPWYKLSSTGAAASDMAPADESIGSDAARSRTMQMLLNSALEYHISTGTFATMAPRSVDTSVMIPVEYEFAHYGWAGGADKTARARTKPVHRLQSLGSRFANNRLLGTPFAGFQAPSGLNYARRPLQQIESKGPTLSPAGQRLPSLGKMSLNRLNNPQISVRDLSPYRTTATASVDAEQEPDSTLAVAKKRDRRGPRLFSESDRLANAVALQRTVLGGLDQRINWGVVAHMLGFRYEADFLRRRWDAIKNVREDDVRTAISAIYEPFLEAYDRGEVPAVNFNNLAKTDWEAMLAWLERTVLIPGKPLDNRNHCLPQSPDHFKLAYSVIESISTNERPKDSWFTSVIEKGRKDIALEFVYGTALKGQTRPTKHSDDAQTVVLRSFIRAITITKMHQYNPAAAAEKIARFDVARISLVSDEMLTDKTLRHLNKGRQQPGRNYEIHDLTWAVFRRWPGKENEWMYLREIAAARTHIIDVFDNHDTITLDSQTPELEIVVLTNMLRQGLLRVISQLPDRNDSFEAPFPKLSAWGYADYSYNAKTLDKNRLRFPVVFEKTAELDRDHGLTPSIDIPLRPVVGSKDDDGRLPFWVDIHGNFAPDIWEIVLRSVLHLVVFRTGVTVDGIVDSHNRRLLAWEIDLVLEWMRQSGIAETCGPGSTVNGMWTGGWKASEWWYCAFNPEMITWDARSN